MAKIIYTMTMTEMEKEALQYFINHNLPKHSEKMRTEGKSRVFLYKVVDKVTNAKTVVV